MKQGIVGEVQERNRQCEHGLLGSCQLLEEDTPFSPHVGYV